MFSAILAILILFLSDLGRSKGMQFRSVNKSVIWLFGVNFAILMILGACHVENPFIAFGQISTVFYFLYFIIIGGICLVENSVIKFSHNISNNIIKTNKYNPSFYILQSTNFWTIMSMITTFIATILYMVATGNYTGANTLIDQFFRCLIEISNLVATNQMSVPSARAILAALEPLYNSLPVLIEHLKNILSHVVESHWVSRALEEVIYPALGRTIKILQEFLRGR